MQNCQLEGNGRDYKNKIELILNACPSGVKYAHSIFHWSFLLALRTTCMEGMMETLSSRVLDIKTHAQNKDCTLNASKTLNNPQKITKTLCLSIINFRKKNFFLQSVLVQSLISMAQNSLFFVKGATCPQTFKTSQVTELCQKIWVMLKKGIFSKIAFIVHTLSKVPCVFRLTSLFQKIKTLFFVFLTHIFYCIMQWPNGQIMRF